MSVRGLYLRDELWAIHTEPVAFIVNRDGTEQPLYENHLGPENLCPYPPVFTDSDGE